MEKTWAKGLCVDLVARINRARRVTLNENRAIRRRNLNYNVWSTAVVLMKLKRSCSCDTYVLSVTERGSSSRTIRLIQLLAVPFNTYPFIS